MCYKLPQNSVPYKNLYSLQGLENFSIKGQMLCIFGLIDNTPSIAAIQLYLCRVKAA